MWILRRDDRGPGPLRPGRGIGRPTPRRATRPSLVALEDRALRSSLPAAPTADEQYMLQLLNRARANPAAEGQRLVGLTKTDPVLANAAKGWDLSAFLQKIDSIGPGAPLAFNTRLIAAARDHDLAMLAANAQTHAPSGFLASGADGLVAGDGQVYYPVGSSAWATGENVFAYSANVNGASGKNYADYFHEGFLIDWGNADFGHLTNALAPSPSQSVARKQLPFSEIGIGLLTGATPTTAPPANPENPANAGLDVGPALVTEEFGWKSGNAFLTGAIYRDADHDNFYTPGEGLGGVTIQAVGREGEGTYQTVTWDSGGYSLALPPGTYNVTAWSVTAPPRGEVVTIGQDNVAWDVQYDPAASVADIPVPGDYDGDGKADVATYRPSTGAWFLSGSASGPRSFSFGQPNLDVPVPADYDGDGKVDPAVYRPSTGEWLILGSKTGARVVQFGAPGIDNPVPGDYDGDGKADPAVYRPSTGQWLILGSATGAKQVSFGQPGVDQPAPADYDGDGKVDIAVYRPTTSQWLIQGTASLARAVSFGQPGGADVPIPGDYDGDGKADLAVYRPATGQWYFAESSSGGVSATFGQAGTDVPVPADYDGDHKADPAVFRPASAGWFTLQSSRGTTSTTFGQGGTGRAATGLAPATVANYGVHATRIDYTTPAPAPAKVATPSGPRHLAKRKKAK